jgi:hypothetical protein
MAKQQSQGKPGERRFLSFSASIEQLESVFIGGFYPKSVKKVSPPLIFCKKNAFFILPLKFRG